MKIKKGDTVKVLLGKDHGKSGQVLRLFNKEDKRSLGSRGLKTKVLVEGINMYKRHVRKMGQSEGGIMDITKPVDISNVALVCPGCKKETRVGYKIEGQTKMRVCKKCKEVIK